MRPLPPRRIELYINNQRSQDLGDLNGRPEFVTSELNRQVGAADLWAKFMCTADDMKGFQRDAYITATCNVWTRCFQAGSWFSRFLVHLFMV